MAVAESELAILGLADRASRKVRLRCRAEIRALDHNVWPLLEEPWLARSPSREPDRKASISASDGGR